MLLSSWRLLGWWKYLAISDNSYTTITFRHIDRSASFKYYDPNAFTSWYQTNEYSKLWAYETPRTLCPNISPPDRVTMTTYLMSRGYLL